MKRNLALLLAVVMLLTLPMNVFAATDNSLSKNAAVVPDATVMYEQGSTNVFDGTSLAVLGSEPSDVNYLVEGSDLIINVRDAIVSGQKFYLDLENAVWFFRTNTSTAWNALAADYPELYSGGVANYAAGASTERWVSISRSSFNVTRGSYFPANVNGAKVGVYIRTAGAAGGILGNNAVVAAAAAPANITEVPYTLAVSQTGEKRATVTLHATIDTQSAKSAYNANNPYVIRIPLAIRTTAKADVNVIIDYNNLTSITGGTRHLVGIAGGGATKTWVNDPQSARERFELDKVIIQESRINTVNDRMGRFSIAAPQGFYFESINNARVLFENFGSATTPDYTVEWQPGYRVSTYDPVTGARTDTSATHLDKSVIEVQVQNLSPSDKVNGSMIITGLVLVAEEDAAWGDVNLQIKPVSFREFTRVAGVVTYGNNWVDARDWPTSQTFLGGKRVDWTISLKAVAPIPELVNGRYMHQNYATALDEYHKTAHVIFTENAVNAWWAARTTDFTLPAGMKFRKVDITKTDNMIWAPDTAGSPYTEGEFKGLHYYDYNRGGVKVDGGKMTWSNLRIKKDKKATVEFDVWVSIEIGTVGDVVLTAGGTSVPEQGESGELPNAVIAKQISPVTLTTKSSDIRIGYQYQETQDIIITETKVGNLLKDKDIKLSVTDFISNDVYFATDISAKVTSGNLKIKDTRFGQITDAWDPTSLVVADKNNAFVFTIKASSTDKPSEITLSNVSLKIDRTVPETNDHPYKLVIWGPGIAENYGNPSLPLANDRFPTPGISADYLKVVSSADDKTSVLAAKVEVTIGETYYLKNGVSYEMDASAYVSEKSNSTMVPLRFVANAFGIRDDQVIWDDVNKTVTIMAPYKVLQFKVGSSTMLINGAAVTMFSPDRKAVSAENTNSRVYVPFRALGEAFGIEVGWDDSTKTAIYNPNAVIGDVSVTDADAAPVETPAE